MMPFVFPILIPFVFPFGFLVMLFSSFIFSAWWPTRLVCFVFRLTPVILVERGGEVVPGFLRKNAVGTVMAYEGIFPQLGDRALEDGTVAGVIFKYWKPMP